MDSQATSAAGTPAKKLLIVEDDFYIRNIYKHEAQDRGFDVHEAVDGADALQKVKFTNPDIILLDIMLPKINGLEVLKTIKSWDEYQNIPVIMISNVSDAETKQRAMEAQAAQYIVKFDSTPREIIDSLQKYNPTGNTKTAAAN